MRRPVLLAFVPILLWLASSCGLRSGVDSGAAGANPSHPATTTAAGLAPPSSTTPTSAKAMPPSTKPAAAAGASSTVKPTFPPSTKAATATTAAPTTAAPTTAAPPTTAADKNAALCAAVKVYSMHDIITMGDHLVADPNGFEKALADMVANAPDSIKADLQSMQPFTKVVANAVRAGDITSMAQLQTYLTNAPTPDLEAWVAAQQKVVPVVAPICGTPVGQT